MEKKELENKLNNEIEKINRAREEWLEYCANHNVGDNDRVLLVMDRDIKYGYLVLKHADEFVRKKNLSGLHILTNSKIIFDSVEQYIEGLKSKKKCSDKQIEGLLKLNHLYKFTNQLIICSLQDVEDVDGTRFEDVHGISAEDLACTAILDMPDYVRSE